MLLFIICLREDHQIIDVDHEDVLHVTEDVIHHVLEGGRRVAEAKVHDQWFISAFMSPDLTEGGFPFISFLDTNIVVSPSEIHLGEEFTPLEPVDELRNEGERIRILDRVFIKVPVVLHHALLPILLRDEEHRGCLRGLRGADVSFS
ncbi:hypothetical protein M404DRAFT_158633 [Pisolithus tinctorius Marx 270]|uniref:Uncharacterized protein n=1 Tax=Pisolithus tinctorius Marx 270 TaxID=870435 RepID=A0A0C3JKA5_PISTI|nr:hypothetical protein M404DRAFT_158633 [Pisolithus tinctorius Marx 270]